MMVQRLTGACSVTVLLGCLIPAARAMENLPSRAALQEMGLAGLEVLSDDQAMSIRGQGFKKDGNGDTWITADGKSWASGGSGRKSGVSIDFFHVIGDAKAYGRNHSSSGKSSKKSGHGGKKKGGHGKGPGDMTPSASSSWNGSSTNGNNHGVKNSHAKSNHGGNLAGHSNSGNRGGWSGGHKGGHGKSVTVHASGFSRASI